MKVYVLLILAATKGILKSNTQKVYHTQIYRLTTMLRSKYTNCGEIYKFNKQQEKNENKV